MELDTTKNLTKISNKDGVIIQATWMSRKKETYQKTEKPSVMDITL